MFSFYLVENKIEWANEITFKYLFKHISFAHMMVSIVI